MTKLPASPGLFDKNWRHVSGLCMADPNFNEPGNIDVLIGVDVFSQIVNASGKDLLVLMW